MIEECRRIAGGRLLWLLFGGAMVINLWIIWNFREQREYVEISRTLAESGVEYDSFGKEAAVSCRVWSAVFSDVSEALRTYDRGFQLS